MFVLLGTKCLHPATYCSCRNAFVQDKTACGKAHCSQESDCKESLCFKDLYHSVSSEDDP